MLCSALSPPGGVTTSYIRYGSGVDKITEIMMLAIDIGVISKGGAWYSFEIEGEKKKFQGTEKLRQFFVDNPEAYDIILKVTKETMGLV